MADVAYDGPPLRPDDVIAARFPGPPYAIVRSQDAAHGIVVCGKFDAEWVVNPFGLRPVVRVLLERAEKAEAERDHYKAACIAQQAAIVQTLGKALGYARYVDDLEHVAESLSVEAARTIADLRRELAVFAAITEDAHANMRKLGKS